MTDRPTVLATRALPPNVEARLKADYDVRLNEADRVLSPEVMLAQAEGATAILCCHSEKFTAEVIGRLPKSVKVVANISVGVDHCDLAAAKAAGLIVTNTPDVLSDATAEIAILCLLGAARRGGEGERLIREGAWRNWSLAFMVGTQVTGKRLGVIGMGRVGRVIAKRARGFDMEIHYHNRSRLGPDLEAGAVYHESLEEMLPLCDFLAISCPATPDTIRLIDSERLALLPRGAILVNTARGAVVDEDALIDALQSGRLAAAGLDVFNNEPAIDPRFAGLTNTFLLPHIGSATKETRDAMGFRALDNIDAVVAGREPRDRVA